MCTWGFKKIVEQLDEDIFKSGVSVSLVDKSNYADENIKMAVRVYDKYFMRNSSRASLNVTIIDSGREIFISAIGAGGGNGAFFNFSWGAEGELTEVVANSIKKMGL
ncbi:DUF6054 family protein [Anaerotignum sp.]|uniref:DUF6054 family protein n=1 Tax=Anaerotignum sp. TaxID=2039241 RepID=UPI0027146022|nr:DUF6054 family protein [Anaerotignum sp.]